MGNEGHNHTVEDLKLLVTLKHVSAAIREFLNKQQTLLHLNVNERSLTHKLAEYLQLEFRDWHVDCEYNRDLGDPKRLPQSDTARTDATDGPTIFPDIIVHRRNTKENLVVIEVKKEGNRDQAGMTRDIEKLTKLTRQGDRYSYACGIHLFIDCERKAISAADVYVSGQEDSERSADLLALLH